MNEELLKELKGLLPWVVVAAIAVGGYYGVKNHLAEKKIAASAAVVNTYTVEELESAVSKFGSTASGGALKIRLAKKYFDAGRYQEALDQYEALVKDAPDGFADVPVVGRAQALEALGKYAEAQQAYDDFVAVNPKSYLTLTAQLGAARSLAQSGDAKAALERLAELTTAVGGDEIAKARIATTEDCIRRMNQK